MPDAAVNVEGIYAALRDNINFRTFRVPSFEHAVRLTQLTIDLLSSSSSGQRAEALGWPEQ